MSDHTPSPLGHYFTIYGKCPCMTGDVVVQLVMALYRAAPDLPAFAAALDREGVVGRRVWYAPEEGILYISKHSAAECGMACPSGEGAEGVGRLCHCDYYSQAGEALPRSVCQCGAEFYRPIFAPIFGEHVRIDIAETVLAGDRQCTLAVHTARPTRHA